jgi:hypothetical protein
MFCWTENNFRCFPFGIDKMTILPPIQFSNICYAKFG